MVLAAMFYWADVEAKYEVSTLHVCLWSFIFFKIGSGGLTQSLCVVGKSYTPELNQFLFWRCYLYHLGAHLSEMLAEDPAFQRSLFVFGLCKPA